MLKYLVYWYSKTRGEYTTSQKGLHIQFNGDDTMSVWINKTYAEFSTKNTKSAIRTISRIESEFSELSQVLDTLRENDVFYDIGANTGIYSCFAASLCSEVVAFEPYEPNVEECERNIQINSENINLHNIGLSNKQGTVGLNVPNKPSPGFGSASINSKKKNDLVQTDRGDRLIAEEEFSAPNVVKIDVEGAEPLVLDGLSETLSDSHCRVVFCEVHLPSDSSSRNSIQDHNWKEEQLIKLIENEGYCVDISKDTQNRLWLKGIRRKSDS